MTAASPVVADVDAEVVADDVFAVEAAVGIAAVVDYG